MLTNEFVNRLLGCYLPPMSKAKVRTPYLPIAFNLADADVLVVGAGDVALRKLQGLKGRGAKVTVISPQAKPAARRMLKSSAFRWTTRAFREADLQGRDLVFAMTDDVRLNERIARSCRKRQIPCNAASGEEQGFLMMSLVERGPLQIAISTGGLVPFAARVIRRFLEGFFDASWQARLVRLSRQRLKLIKKQDHLGLAKLARLSWEELLTPDSLAP